MNKKWRVLLLDTKEGNPNHYILLAVESALKDHPSVEYVCSVPYSDALNVAILEQCNLFFAFDGEQIDRGLCQRLATACGKSVLWITEDPYENQINVRNVQLFDFVFTNDRESLQAYHGKASHLPFAAFPRFHYHEMPAQDDGHYLYDLLFVGTAWPNRVALINDLLPRLQGLKIKLGLPYNKHIPVPTLGLPESSYLWKTANSELARLTNRSRIVLTLHRNFSGSGNHRYASTPGPRLFEAALAGGFQLVDLTLNESLAYFESEKEIIGFNRTDECLEQIKYYLAHPEERLSIARRAQKKCLSQHLYSHRVDYILKTIENPPVFGSGAKSTPKTTIDPIKILYIAHNVKDVPPFGGVEVYVDLLSKSLPEKFVPLIYYPDRRVPLGEKMVLLNARTGLEKHYSFRAPNNPYKLMDYDAEVSFSQMLHEERIGLVHIQHLLGHPWSLPLVARTLGIPTLMTMHDYFSVCFHFNLISETGQYCRIPELPPVTCDFCLRQQDGAAFGSQALRRGFIGSILENLDSIIFLSDAERNIIQTIYPNLLNVSKLVVEGTPCVEKPPVRKPRSTTDRLKAVVLGNFTHVKGAEIFLKVFDAMRDDDIEFHLYGSVQSQRYNKLLKSINAPNVRVHGEYSIDELHEKLVDADVSLLLSIWPETYLLTLSESWRAGVVPIVSDIGAPGERVQDQINGYKVPVNQAGPVIQLLRQLIVDRRALERIRNNIHPGFYRTLDQHLKVLTSLYDQLTEQYRVASRTEAFYKYAPDPRRASASNLYWNDPVWLKLKNRPSFIKKKIKAAKNYVDLYGFFPFIRAASKAALRVIKIG